MHFLNDNLKVSNNCASPTPFPIYKIHVIHPVPCCEPCSYCGRKIARGLQSNHELYCEKKKNPITCNPADHLRSRCFFLWPAF